jgi:hypothetical protein
MQCWSLDGMHRSTQGMQRAMHGVGEGRWFAPPLPKPLS